MPTDFASYYQGYMGGGGGYQVPPAPQYQGGGGGGGGIGGMLSKINPIFGGLFGGDNGPNAPPTGRREYYKGQALLNTYNWLLPYTAQTVQQGADIFGDIYRNQAAKSKAYELAQFQSYAPQYAQAILNADPRQAQALQAYNQQTQSNVGQAQQFAGDLYSQLYQPMNQAATRNVIQASLGNNMPGFGPNARNAALSYIQTGLVGEQLQQQRQQQYQGALGSLYDATSGLAGAIQANKSVLGDPFQAFAGRPSQPQGANIQSPDYGGFNNDLFSYGTNMDILRRNLAAAHTAGNQALIGQLVGSVLGGASRVGGGMI